MRIKFRAARMLTSAVWLVVMVSACGLTSVGTGSDQSTADRAMEVTASPTVVLPAPAPDQILPRSAPRAAPAPRQTDPATDLDSAPPQGSTATAMRSVELLQSVSDPRVTGAGPDPTGPQTVTVAGMAPVDRVVSPTPTPSGTAPTQPPAPRDTVHAVSTPTFLPGVAKTQSRAMIPVLCYHHIRNWTYQDNANARSYIVPPAQFAAQMAWLEAAGYHTIDPDQLVAYLTTGKPLPYNPVLITFDDAWSSPWDNAVPELLKHHFRATFFITTSYLDRREALTSAQVRALDHMGMTIGVHTVDHRAVTRYSQADWDQELLGSLWKLQTLVGHPIHHFAYPYGLWNRAAFPHLRSGGFATAFQLGTRMDPTDPLYTLPRSIIEGLWTLPQFAREVRAAS